ncbi:MAG: hypothetical protein LQ343_000366 [Gyalolechia ehrenbergii]|nr:MAG: hypothetical protein LQ343_000366 [Gyalolechia ehrenbergii]
MPSYLCHVCSAYNAFPSPLCNNCTHKYCIACLPVIPNPSPLRTSFTSDDDTEDSGSGFSSIRSSMIEEIRHIHPAYRCTTPVEYREEEEEEEEEDIIGENKVSDLTTAFEQDSAERLAHPPESRAIDENQKEEPTLTIESPSPIPLFPPSTTTIEPIIPIPQPGPPTQPPPLLTSPQPLLLPDWPPWETAITTLSSNRLHPHSRHRSVDEHRNKLERELRRTMSMQSEKVSRLMRKGSMRLKEAAARASSVGRARAGMAGV